LIDTLPTPTRPMTDSQDFLQAAVERAELIEQLLAIGTALSSTHNLEQLLSLILTKSREITCSDAGSVYLVDHRADQPTLIFKVAQNFSKPATSLRSFAMPLTEKSLAGYVALTGKTLNIPDAYELDASVPYQLDRSFDQSIAYRTRSVLVLPMKNQAGEAIGVLQLINRKTNPDIILTPDNALTATQPFSDGEMRIVRSLASQAAISIERNHLEESIEHLFESFVRASVQVIEARDPCTSGHSERVADLTVRLSEEVSSLTRGSFATTHFNDRQLQEIRYAALLHDFGKVSVPEAILVKAKKLYPLQLDLIQSRFAFVRRTLEMQCVEAKYDHLLRHSAQCITSSSNVTNTCSHCDQVDALDLELTQKLKQLEAYWQVILEANEPHVLSEEPLMQLKELATYTYRDVNGTQQPLITLEEMEKLMVRRGTLTDSEQLAIQSHVSHTYEFLKRIPWTKDLQDVPSIAYGHHEKLDGTGYPRGLNAREIPLQSQMMAIADIYDALTAGDRPYKRGLPTETAMRILYQEANTNKLNLELVQLFEQRQVFSLLGHQL